MAWEVRTALDQGLSTNSLSLTLAPRFTRLARTRRTENCATRQVIALLLQEEGPRSW